MQLSSRNRPHPSHSNEIGPVCYRGKTEGGMDAEHKLTVKVEADRVTLVFALPNGAGAILSMERFGQPLRGRGGNRVA